MNKIENALMAIPTPETYEEWLKISISYKCGGGSYETWDQWCQRGNGYDKPQNLSTWKSIKSDGGITEATLFQMARSNGWKPDENESGEAILPLENQEKVRYIINEGLKRQKDAMAYLEKRGIQESTARRFKIGYMEMFKMAGTEEPRIIIPYPDELYYTARRVSPAQDDKDKKYLYPKRETAGGKRIFNRPALQNDVCFVVEGQIDAISIEQEGCHAIGCNEARQLTDLLDTGTVRAKTFILIPDNDITGFTKAIKMQNALIKYDVRILFSILPDKYHDANDMLVKNPQEFFNWLDNTKGNAVNLQTFVRGNGPPSLLNGHEMIERFRESVHLNLVNPIATGFAKLDKALSGGLYPSLIILGAVPSIGKTTLLNQICDNIASSGKKVLFISLEMKCSELIAKSISRLTFKKDKVNAKTAVQLLSGSKYKENNERQNTLIRESFREYEEKCSNNIFCIEKQGITINEIANEIDRFIKKYGEKPVIAIDYLQKIRTEKMSSTDKGNIDNILSGLIDIIKRHSIPILCISSYNRGSYDAKSSISAYKESGNIEYDADLLLGLQLTGIGTRDFDPIAAKRKTPRDVELVIEKNRNGESGNTIGFKYYAEYNYFEEK